MPGEIVEFDSDLQAFGDALRLYKLASDKDHVDILNKRGVSIALKAVPKTPMVSLAKIRKHDPKKRPQKRRGGKNPTGLLFALTSNAGKGNRQKAADRAFGRRSSGRGALKAGWLAVAKKAGARTRKDASAKMIADAEWNPADVFRKVTMIGNGYQGDSAKDADALAAIGLPGLRKAVQADVADMIKYANRKLGITADEFSAPGARG